MAISPIPNIFASCGLIPIDDDFQVSPALLWHTFAEDWGPEFNTAFDGRQHKSTGEIKASAQPKPQDTYIFGTASRTGRAFDVVSGTVKDDWIHPEWGKYGLLMPDGASGASFEVKDHATSTPFSHQLV